MNTDRIEVPDVPLQEIVEETLAAKLQAWRDFFSKASPRIKVLTPTKELLDELGILTKKSFEYTSDDELDVIGIVDWPSLEEVAFIIRVDNAMPGGESVFSVKNYSLFLYGDVAYDLSYFGQDEYCNIHGFEVTYSLREWEPDLLKWEFRKKLILGKIADLQDRVPNPTQ